MTRPARRRGRVPFRFRDLPPELRNRVYDFYVTRSDYDASRIPSYHKFLYESSYCLPEEPLQYRHGPPEAERAIRSRKRSMATLGTAILLTCKQLRHEAIAAVYRDRHFELNLAYSTNGWNSPFSVDRSFRVPTHPTLQYVQVLVLKIDLHGFENSVDPGRLSALQNSFRPLQQMKALRTVLLNLLDCAATEHVLFVVECLVDGFMEDLLPMTEIGWFAKQDPFGQQIGDLVGHVVGKRFDEVGQLKPRSIRLKAGTFSYDAKLNQS